MEAQTQVCRDCGREFPYDEDADRCPACAGVAAGVLAPFVCEGCGATDRWFADYPVATRQSVDVGVAEDGEPQVIDYTGTLDTYDDAEGQDEAFVCGACGHRHQLGEYRFIPTTTEG